MYMYVLFKSFLVILKSIHIIQEAYASAVKDNSIRLVSSFSSINQLSLW